MILNVKPAGVDFDRAGKLPIAFPVYDMCTAGLAVDGDCRNRATAVTVKLPIFDGFSTVFAETEGWRESM